MLNIEYRFRGTSGVMHSETKFPLDPTKDKDFLHDPHDAKVGEFNNGVYEENSYSLSVQLKLRF